MIFKKKSSIPKPGDFVMLGDQKTVCLDCSPRGDGKHGIFLINAANKKLVLKCYGRKRSAWQTLLDNLEHLIVGKSLTWAKTRFKTEKKSLEIWAKHGFDVFRQPSDSSKINSPKINIGRPFIIFEYVTGRTALEYFADPKVEHKDKIELLKQFIPEWNRRHKLAMETQNRYLLQEHPSFKHVFKSNDNRLIYFDFETVYTPRHSIKALIGREIAGYVRSLIKVVPEKKSKEFLDLIINEYPDTEYLSYPDFYFFRHPNLLLRLLCAIDRQMPRHKKRHSKYPVAKLLDERLKFHQDMPGQKA